MLLNELDGYVEARNDLQDQLNKTDSRTTMLLQIDEWQRATLEKVIQTADQARQQVKKLLSSDREEIERRFREFSSKLNHLKETEDFVEDELTQLKELVHIFKQDLKQLSESPSVELHIEQSDQIFWNRLIYVKDHSTATITTTTTWSEQDEQQAIGELINNFICTNNLHFSYEP
ncbi:unnamed protein product [Adineta steineri]|uniref:Uncharacterized protein n=1 Tax=Adineta steineri TaxID=433720 RepID=A0A815BLQ8_9BILA|nr:unnamed protein product [Adineta steineri]CAF1328101.1 unnamed protein product [Adineta steineri]